MRNYSGREKWIPGVVISKLGPLSYTIDAGGQENRRHIDPLKKRAIRTSDDGDSVDEEFMPVTREQTQNLLELEGDTQGESEETIPDPTAEDARSQVPGEGTQPNLKRYRLRANRNAPDRFGH